MPAMASCHHLLLPFFLLLYFQLISGQNSNCTSSSCGDIEIRYPFWVLPEPVAGEPQPDYYCGHEDLRVTCTNNQTLTFNTSTDSYTVRDIDYTHKTISLVDTDVLSSECPRVQHDLDISNIPDLSYNPAVVNLTFFFGCENATSGGQLEEALAVLNQSTCLDDEQGKAYVLFGTVGPDVRDWLSVKCRDTEVVAPVLAKGVTQANVATEFPKMLRGGFLLDWKDTSDKSDCGACEASGGFCGYSNKSGNGMEFVCFCDDGSPHSIDCRDKSGKAEKIGIGVGLGLFAACVGVGVLCCCKRRKNRKSHSSDIMWMKTERIFGSTNFEMDNSSPLNSVDLNVMDVATITEATNNFSMANKLGEGGFGPVYKGLLSDGKQVAIKRLSSTSTQGSTEFKNEVQLIAKLQHRNLVRLTGYCMDGKEKLLVYEYLRNGSLDTILFDAHKRAFLDWKTRLQIIFGVTRGLLYLHEDSRLKVVHRDLKASNVLLDFAMNPKISDFGLARIFTNDQNEANTNRVMGTYGYMAPEFAMEGLFSVKSDVYSYGVLLLEIVSGEKNGRSHLEQYEQSLPKRAWEMWMEGRGQDVIDPLMVSSCSTEEALRCIHIGLLCVQENATDRPSMSMVLNMLRNLCILLPEPRQPPSFVRSVTSITNIVCPDALNPPSINQVTMTDLQGR